MSWADAYIQKLKNGETVKFRPRGGSMVGKIVCRKSIGDRITYRSAGFRI